MGLDISQIKKEISNILPEITSIRHHLHANPELSLKEFRTCEFIRNYLKGLDVNVYDPFLTTDVVALLSGKNGGKNVTLRADIDALPLQEQSVHSYCSTASSVMHACGHDGHTAILLGAAAVLGKLKDSINGSVRFVFQPGEEIVAAGKNLINKGILESPMPGAVLALHSMPGMPVGSIASKPGPIMAAADLFKVIIKGKGGHGSTPEETIDPIFTASRVINGLYLLSSRKLRAQDSLVVSICSIHGGANANIIPEEVVVEGSVRYFTKKIGGKIPSLFEQAVKAECAYTGADYNLEYNRAYIPTINDVQTVATGKGVTERYIEKSDWIDLDEPVMGSEDFSYYIDNNAGAMFFLGMGEDSAALHSSTFDFNDKALKNGILFFVLSTFELLSD
jgi:amidohydrolase